jgi:CubicO group peptidase (beta-lactamase class C family)
MRMTRRLLSAIATAGASSLLLVVLGASAGAVPALTDVEARGVDAVFAAYDTPRSPGCAVGIVRGGSLAYARGYGQASVELGVPITAETVFDIGSVSKQFTAASILLLAEDGALSLDDDIRKYLLEIPAYERPVTIRHLLTHTSGLRDYTTLLALADYDSRDVTTVPQALAILTRQRGSDFAAGERFEYDNTGFFLASLIVERVSGQSLAEFAMSRIFRPLGMSGTRYAGSHSISVAGRATGYTPAGDAFAIDMSNWEQTGDGGVQTSVQDMARWVANFDTHVVGRPTLTEAMARPGALDSGAPIDYGLGQFVGTYRGIDRVHHGGSWAGFKAVLQRYPSEQTSVIVLCNRGEVNPEALSDGVTDAVLRGRLGPPASADAAPAIVSGDVSALEGTYWSEARGDLLAFDAKDRTLILVSGERRTPLAPWGAGTFMALRPYKIRFSFAAPAGGPPTVERVIEERVHATYTRQVPWRPSEGELARLAGTWHSEELDADYDLRLMAGHLARIPRRGPPEPLVPAFESAFTWGDAVIRFAPGRDRFEVLTGGSAHGVTFVRR